MRDGFRRTSVSLLTRRGSTCRDEVPVSEDNVSGGFRLIKVYISQVICKQNSFTYPLRYFCRTCFKLG